MSIETPTVKPSTLDYGNGITCIDTMLHRPGLASCYLIVHDGMAGFIDTGTHTSLPILLEVLKLKNIPREKVAWVMPTHVHLDHAGGVGGLMDSLPEAQLLIHPRGARHMIGPEKLEQGSIAVYGEERFRKIFGQLIPVDASRVIEADDGFELDFNGRLLKFFDTPGHARHHYCVYDELSKGLFTGDTCGASYPELNGGKERYIFPPTTPVQFDPEAWHHSIDRLMELRPEKIFVTHFGMHENPSSLMKLLHRTIDDYVEISVDNKNHKNRKDRIRDSILLSGVNYLLDNSCGMDLEGIKKVIGGDMELNAQGLDHWLGLRDSA